MDARTLDQLVDITRERLDDTGTTRPRWPSTSIARALNEAQREAALRGRLLRDDVSNRLLITIEEGKMQYLLHPSIFELISVRNTTTNKLLRETSVFKLESRDDQWRNRTSASVCQYYVDVLPNERLRLNLVDIPAATEAPVLLRLEVYRLPWDEMELEAEDEPEIAPRHHEGLVEWACYRCFMKRDPDTYDPVKAADHLAIFTDQFGQRPDANVHRKQREKPSHTTVARDF